jgi:pyroglutamyl-peptidase
MKALVLGFEPFNGDVINPAAEAVTRLRSALGSMGVSGGLLPTSFARALPALDAAIAHARPDIVLGVGLAGGRSALSLERIAINLDEASIADNDGAVPVGLPIVAGGPAAYFATLPLRAAAAALRAAGLPASISNTAGTFVCNHFFYGLMHRAAVQGFRGGFLHVPYLPQQAARHGGAPSMAIEHIVQGIEIVLAVAAERREDIVASEGAVS